MATIDIKDTAGKKLGEREVADSVFAIEPHTFAMHQVVRSQLAGQRAGTHSSKGRSEVSGGGAKPWRQKGTGRARQGTIRAPQWKGGGVVFGPTPRAHGFSVPNKVVKLAMRSALSAKAAEGVLHIVDDLAFTEPSTKRATEILAKLQIEGRVTVVVANDDIDAMLSFRNIPKVRVIAVSDSNTYDLVNNNHVLMTSAAVTWLEGVLV
ncbi:MAG: 50S ribosomal protein L4 [Actinobacteria bacterium]|nr:50S ribosomal protein L4 [Actinomycetota bacterium]MCL5887187.1 50S ribosomal protein L4 [Actinomycetota bacterium]